MSDDYRDTLVSGFLDAQGSTDDWLMKLSAGALGVAVALVRAKPEAHWQWLLWLSWALLALAVLSILLSFRTSRDSFLESLKQLDDGTNPDRIYRERPGGKYAQTTERLNRFALWAFMIGVLCLGVFIACNAGKLA